MASAFAPSMPAKLLVSNPTRTIIRMSPQDIGFAKPAMKKTKIAIRIVGSVVAQENNSMPLAAGLTANLIVGANAPPLLAARPEAREACMSKFPEYMWVVNCYEDKGWGTEYDGLWGGDRRVFLRQSEAREAARHFLESGEWGDPPDPPVYVFEKMDVVDILSDKRLRLDLMSAVEHPVLTALGDAMDEATAWQDAERLERKKRIDLEANMRHYHHTLLEWIAHRGPNGRALSVDASGITTMDLTAEWMTSTMRELADATFAPLLVQANAIAQEIDAWVHWRRSPSSYGPSLSEITFDGNCVMIYQTSGGQYIGLDGWWRIDTLRARLASDQTSARMTADEMSAIGVYR